MRLFLDPHDGDSVPPDDAPIIYGRARTEAIAATRVELSRWFEERRKLEALRAALATNAETPRIRARRSVRTLVGRSALRGRVADSKKARRRAGWLRSGMWYWSPTRHRMVRSVLRSLTSLAPAMQAFHRVDYRNHHR